MLALSLVKMLFALLSEYRKRIEELFESHPDHDLFGSLPGAGPKLAPRLLGEIAMIENASMLMRKTSVTVRAAAGWLFGSFCDGC